MIAIINAIIEKLGVVIMAVLALLPTSPFTFVSGIDSGILSALNWLFPIASMIAHIELFVAAVAFYYAIRVILRWGKVAGD